MTGMSREEEEELEAEEEAWRTALPLLPLVLAEEPTCLANEPVALAVLAVKRDMMLWYFEMKMMLEGGEVR